MKKTITMSIAGCLMLSGLFTSCVSSQSFMPVKGHGERVDKSFNMSDFHGIEVSGGFDLVLSQGTSEGVMLSAQENLFDYIHVEVVQGILKIYTENNLMPTQSMKAQVAFKEIDAIRVSGGGDVTASTDINVHDLNIEISGGGNMTSIINTGELACRISGGGDGKINGSARVYRVDMTGGGDLESTIVAGSVSCRISGGGDLDLTCNEESTEVNIDLSGGGNADVSLNTGKLICTVSGGGNAGFSGKAANLEIKINGGGDINAEELEAHTASIQASGGSDVHVNVSRELKANISGGGDIYYSGTAEVVSIDARGGSEVHKE
jgi:hypothetical protein